MRSSFLKLLAPVLLWVSIMSSANCNKVFPVSTEFQIGKIQHMVRKAPKGVYISVGGERSFRGISMDPNVTQAYLLDVSPEIIRYNKINTELLKAPTRKDYLSLRWLAPYSEWEKLKLNLKQEDFDWWNANIRDLENMGYSLPEALNRYGYLPGVKKIIAIRESLALFYQAWKSRETPWIPEKQFIESINYKQMQDLGKKFNIPVTITEQDWDWWLHHGKNREQECSKTLLDDPAQAIDLGQIVDYKTGNYLFDDELYDRLHNMAMNGRLITMQLDLSNNDQLTRFLDLLQQKKEVISVLDLDNLYFKDYIGDEKYKEIISKLLPLGLDNSILIVMSNFKDYACGQFQIYIGFTFENVRSWPPYFYLQVFFDTLPKELNSLIDGRVYEGQESPPYQYLLGK